MNDLIDKEQIHLFDTLEQLKRHGGDDDIDVPQLIVVGTQSSGKSSVLEALVRFHFPVSNKLCTTFPTKLILRKADQQCETIEYNIRGNSSSNVVETSESIAWTETKIKKVYEEASKIFQVALPVSSDTIPSQDRDKQSSFTKNSLIVRKIGQEMPNVSLVDMPGLRSANQDMNIANDNDYVSDMVLEELQRPTNIVLLVCKATEDPDNQNALGLVQRKDQEGSIMNRTIGVITHLDVKDNDHRDEWLAYLENRKGQAKFTHGWYAVTNLPNHQRNESLEFRDKKEEQFFSELRSQVDSWKNVSTRCGIKNLRNGLKEALKARTQDELGNIINNVKTRNLQLESQIKAFEESHGDDKKRSKYLYNIAHKFEIATAQASRGHYDNPDCPKSHITGEKCSECQGFFPNGGKSDSTYWYRKLNGNIRALNRQFANTMQQCGKTSVVGTTTTAVASRFDAQNSNKHSSCGDKESDSFPRPYMIKDYYTHDEPTKIEATVYEQDVLELIKRNQGKEPNGQASAAAYSELFRHQSAKWRNIAEGHLKAVWHVIGKFKDDLLKYLCQEDKKTLDYLEHKFIEPHLEALNKKANGILCDLLACHEKSHTGFYDGLNEIPAMQGLAVRSAGDLYRTKMGQGASKAAHLALQVVETSVENPLVKLLLSNCIALVEEAGLAAGQTPKDRAFTAQASEVLRRADHYFDVIPVIAMVEMHYEVIMVAFVGYVNSLVVEHGILRQLPLVTFTREDLEQLSSDVLDKIYERSEDEKQKHAKAEADFEYGKKALKVLEQYKTTTSNGSGIDENMIELELMPLP